MPGFRWPGHIYHVEKITVTAAQLYYVTTFVKEVLFVHHGMTHF